MNKLKLSFVFILFLGIFAYFLFHTIYGNRGIIAKNKVEEKISKAASDLDKVRSDRIEIEHNVKLLRPESLDKDMLEEQARKVLGIAGSTEEVIVKDKEEAPKKEK